MRYEQSNPPSDQQDELPLVEIAECLTNSGYPISRTWLNKLILQGRGPAHHIDSDGRILVRLLHAQEWAAARPVDTARAESARVARAAYQQQVRERSPGTGSLPANPQFELADPGLSDLEILADVLSWHIKQNHPAVARRFAQIEGQARRDRLNFITPKIVKVFIAAMNGKIWT